MGRPKGGRNQNHSKEEKLALVKRNSKYVKSRNAKR